MTERHLTAPANDVIEVDDCEFVTLIYWPGGTTRFMSDRPEIVVFISSRG
jgi:hypothetical protein